MAETKHHWQKEGDVYRLIDGDGLTLAFLWWEDDWREWRAALVASWEDSDTNRRKLERRIEKRLKGLGYLQ